MQKFELNNIPISSPFSIADVKDIFIDVLERKESKIFTTFNLDFLRIADNNKAFNKIAKNSELNFPDGAGITSLIKLKYKHNIKRITGNDLFPILLEIVKSLDKKIAIVGSSEETQKVVFKRMMSEFGLEKENILMISPEYMFENSDELSSKVIKTLIDFKPDVLLAALGCPRQEIWLFENMNKIQSKINIGIGATLDFFSGTKQRAPKLFQIIGLEWFWRLLTEPKRLFRRYIIYDLPFYLKMLIRIYTH